MNNRSMNKNRAQLQPRPLVSWSGLVEFGAVFTLVFSLMGFYDPGVLMFELLSHFKLQYTIAALIFSAWLFFLKRLKFALAMMFVCIINAGFIVPWYVGNPENSKPQSSTSTPVKILLSNVNSANTNYQDLIKLIRKEQPTLFIAQEVTEQWLNALSVIEKQLPYKLTQARTDNFGIALFSQVPLSNANIQTIGKAGLPSIIAMLNIDNQPLSIIASHPLPPIGSEFFDKRNEQLDALANSALSLQNPVILIGDLNISMWSSYYEKLISKSNLRNARQGFGVLPTWPTGLPIAMIPIDHCLVSLDISVENVRTGPNIGSDHLPLIVELSY